MFIRRKIDGSAARLEGQRLYLPLVPSRHRDEDAEVQETNRRQVGAAERMQGGTAGGKDVCADPACCVHRERRRPRLSFCVRLSSASGARHGQSGALLGGVRQHDAVTLLKVRLGDPEVGPLLDGLAAEYELRYGPGEEMSTTNDDEFTPPDGVFLVAVERAETLAGGGIRRWSVDTCEVRRM